MVLLFLILPYFLFSFLLPLWGSVLLEIIASHNKSPLISVMKMRLQIRVLKSSPFFLKSNNFTVYIQWRNIAYFLLVKYVFRIDQYAFGILQGSFNVLINLCTCLWLQRSCLNTRLIQPWEVFYSHQLDQSNIFWSIQTYFSGMK